MFLYVDQLEKQLDKEEFQEIGSMVAFKVLETQFQMFIKSRMYLDDEFVVMTRNYFLQYTQLVIPKFRDTLIQHMESIKKSIDERAKHKEEYNSCASLVDTRKAISDPYMMKAELMAEVQTTAKINVFAIGTTATEATRISIINIKQRFASQVDVNNDLSKPVTTHYLPKERESAAAKPHHMIAPGSSRYNSNDMVHKHYLEEAKKKTQESSRNSEPSVMPSARSQSTTNAEHSRNSRSFSDSKHFVCSTCQKCVFNANHDSCVTKFLNEVNSRAKVPSHKTTNRNKPVKQIRIDKKPERQIPIGHRFSIKKTSAVHEKTMTLRSCLRWKPTGKIFRTVGLRWVPTGKIFTPSTTKVDS
ncbi:hypothetical protein Tco_1079192 [Tanacetum coccineum]|uniref:Uncharacterized protein n=1 Tax=Tanacetum coccineum TaxID=301880 RepID=A0ABQ5HR77_9ASTR